MTLVERLRWSGQDAMTKHLSLGMWKLHMEAADEIERLRGALEAIKRATIAGKVCDDVAWFDRITTLHDYCDLTLNPEPKLTFENTGTA